MQAERDVLRQRVLPRLQKAASEYGESIRMVDLRWGVNTTELSEEQATLKIMDVCFEQIDKCDGRMVCLIGNRYGWIPTYDLSKITRKYPLNLSSNVSATELEIQYGILQRQRPQKALVFLRDVVNSLPLELYGNYYDNNPKIDALKEELLANQDCNCYHYSLDYKEGTFSGLDTFEELVYSTLYEYIVAQFNGISVPQHIKIRKQFEAHIDYETMGYYLLPSLDEKINTFINSNNSFAVLKAEPGMGKTAFSARVCKDIGQHKKIFCYFCGYNAECETPLQMLIYFNNHLCDYLGINYSSDYTTIQDCSQIFSYLINQIKDDVIFLIDGIDHFLCPYEDYLTWLPARMPDNIKFIFTTSLKDKSYDKLSEYSDIVLLTMPALDAPDRFIKHLLQVNGKDIQDEILSFALSKHQIKNYYHAKMIADALVLMDQYDFQGIKESGDDINAINNFLRNSLIQFPKSIDGMALFLLHDFGKRISPDLIPEVYIYIACNDGGLRATDLESLLGKNWDELSFELYISFLSGIIIERENGCYDFSSLLIREAVEKLIKWKSKKRVIKHIESLPDNDSLKIRCCLNKSLYYEHFDVVSKLIENNLSSVVLANQFVRCLNHMTNEISAFFMKHDLFKWFFEMIVPRITSVQEQDACMKIIQNVLHSIPDTFKAQSLEYIGDGFKRKAEYEKSENYYREAINVICDDDHISIGRLYYKLATVLRVNSEDDYEVLKKTIHLSLENYNRGKQKDDVENNMYCVLAKFQLIMMELNHSLNGISSIQVFSIGEMKLTDGVTTPHLSFIAKSKIEKIEEDVITSLKTTINSFNEYRKEAESIYQEAKAKDVIENIIDPFILSLDGYDVFGIPEGRIERIKEIREDIEQKLQTHFNLNLYKTLGLLEYEIAKDEYRISTKKYHLIRCCNIWGQFVSQLSLPSFSSKYIDAEMELVKIYLGEGDEQTADEHLQKWSQAQFDYVVNDLRRAVTQCRRYPDELHLALLEELRNNIADVNRTKVRIKQLGENYNRCHDIAQKYFYHLIKSSVFKALDVFEMREKFSFENYWWLKDIYYYLSKKTVHNLDEKAEKDFVSVYLLTLMLQLLNLISDIAQYKGGLYTISDYYNEMVFVLEERHRYEMQRIEKIRFGFLYAKSLINQAVAGDSQLEKNVLFAIKIFNTIRRLLYENEVTPFSLAYPTINQERINFELCTVEISLASYYTEIGLYLSSAKTYETVATLALSLFGERESCAEDHIYLKLALVSCRHALEIYNNLKLDDKILDISRKYEAIKMLDVV